jgi:hypothetical protein
MEVRHCTFPVVVSDSETHSVMVTNTILRFASAAKEGPRSRIGRRVGEAEVQKNLRRGDVVKESRCNSFSVFQWGTYTRSRV